MMIISKTLVSTHNFKKNLLIFIILTTLLNLLTSCYLSIENNTNLSLNTKENRTIKIILKNDSTIKDLEKIETIETISAQDDNYLEITFQNYKNIEEFKEKYQHLYSNIISLSTKVPPIYKMINNFLIAVIFIIAIILFIIIFLNIIDSLISNKNTIAFYKLIGFTSTRITQYLLLTYLSVYLLSYIITILIDLILTTIVSLILKNLNITFVISFINCQYLLAQLFILLVIILLVIIYIFIKIKKITPVKYLQKD